jgi:hypothetical protein
MNDELVARLEAERAKGMPRWTPKPAWEDEQRRRLAAQTWEQDTRALIPTEMDEVVQCG